MINNVVNVVGRKVVGPRFNAPREVLHREETSLTPINVVNVVLHKVATSLSHTSNDITTYDFHDINRFVLWGTV